MRDLRKILLNLALLLTAAPNPDLQAAPTVRSQNALTSFEKARDDIIFARLPFDNLNTLEDWEKKLGRLVSIKSRPFKNRHDDSIDTIYTLVYRGLTIVLYEVPPQRTLTPLRIEVSDNRWQLPLHLKIGSSKQDVLRALGKPDKETNVGWTYGCTDCLSENNIVFGFSGAKVRTIEWNIELD